MAEWAGFRSTSGCSGWSARGGQTYGPFVGGSKASGSSSGSAIATALGLCFAAIGTETCYSIVSPAEKSGVVGYKPTRDLIPSKDIIYVSKKQDTVGVLARTVQDAAHITLLLTASSAIANSSRHLTDESRSEFLQGFHTVANSSLIGLRIGIPWDLIQLETPPQCRLEAFERVLFQLEARGVTIVKDVIIQGWCEYEGLSQDEKQIVLDTDMKTAINEYLGGLNTNPQNIKNLADLVAFIKTCPEEDYPARNAVGLERAQATDRNDGTLYMAMSEKDKFFAGCIESTLNQYDCDVLFTPVLSIAFQTFAAKAGSPVISVPMGIYPHGFPVEIDSKNSLIAAAPGIP
ncbi:amidase signature domain-containing protein [Boeremia exigua]|uniref:amidase signature domain-containing protein n=1 Tax=Boeremia exigua TaxID=749465 RepID=UPI001E8EC431|nr:amidase signature domain-containing protein [Boeremia exigua]KAH6639349.1 amidase signature domain-containing protein [Boeremia exigua]